MDPVIPFVLVIAALLLLGALGEFIFNRTGIPDVVWLVLAGIVAGPLTGAVSPEVLSPAIPFIGAISLVVILAGGAYRMRIEEVAAAAPRALMLALVGFLFSILAMFVFYYIMTHLGLIKPVSPLIWIMCGAIVGGASSIIIMPTLAGGNVDTRVSRLLEVESSATDAMCIVVTMVMIELITSESVGMSRPFVALGRQVGIGVGLGALTGFALLPLLPALRGRVHAYTIFLSVMLLLYGVTNAFQGNGAIAVLVSAMMMGNGSSVMKKLAPSATEYSLPENDAARFIHGQIAFIIKAFFFTLIGLMFPTSPRLIALGALGAIFLLVFRIPAVLLSLRGSGFKRSQMNMVYTAVPRGIAAGVLSAIPFQMGIPGMENLSPGVFSLIVFSILIFSTFFAFISRSDKAAAAKGEVPVPR